jgi:WD40 repeat protein
MWNTNPGVSVFARLTASLALLGLFAPCSVAQPLTEQIDRRARDEPEVVVKAGGRVGTSDAIRFTPLGDFLLGVGDDKVVHVWPHSATGLDTNPAQTRVLRWRSWRDQLGGIKALAISPDGKRVVIGGYGLRVSTVAILDRDTGETLALTWPKVREGDHFDAVMAVAFHPDGKHVGFGTADGTLWLWKPEQLPKPEKDRTWSAPVRVGRFTPDPDGAPFNFPRNVRFADKNTLVGTDADSLVGVAYRGEVLACKIEGPFTDNPKEPTPKGTPLFDMSAGLTNAGLPMWYKFDKAEWSGDGKWLAATTTVSLVLVRSADGKRVVKLELPPDHFARSLAVHPETGKLAIGVTSIHPAVPGKPRFYAERDDEIWVYENPMGPEVPKPKKIAHAGRAENLTFHPTEDRLAVAGGDADEVTLLDLADTKKPVSVARGLGRRLYGINLSESGDVIAVRTGRNPHATDPNDRACGPWVRFDVPRYTGTADSTGKWVGPLNTADGWDIVPDRKSRFIWYAERANTAGGKERLQLLLDPDIDQSPTCFTFVPTEAGKPARVVVGHYYGCSLFELDPKHAAKNPRTGERELWRSKLYIGHGAEVNAVVADKSGTWFVTAGADQTVAAWSLKDWDAQPALGAAFTHKDGQVVVTEVDVGSPAWEAGLSKGDRINRLAVGGDVVYDSGKAKPATPDDAVAALAHPRSGFELFFWWQTPGQAERRGSPTRLKQRPLWKWFPAFDERDRLTDSVIWMWHGSYYFTASAHGDRLVGWHVNHTDTAGTARFEPLERYKHLFLRDDVMTRLTASRSVAEALKVALGPNPQRPTFREVEPTPVELAVKQAVVGKKDIAVSVAVNPVGNNPDLIPHRVELWLNDHRYDAWPTNGKANFAMDVVIPADAFRAGDNQITVLALNPARGRAEATRIIHNPTKPKPPTLLGMVGGIDDYSAHRKALGGGRGAFENLTKAGADATGLRDGLLKYRGDGKHFPAGEVATLLNADATRKGLLASLDKLKAAPVKPDDLLVVFLAGHGDLLGPGGKPRPALPAGVAARGLPAENGQFVFCCPDYLPTKPGATALGAEELFDALATVNCRKLVLLDACHAGGALETNLLRRFIPNGQGPVVIAACDQNQLSFEDDTLGHGAFTYAVLEALGPKFRADRNRDGELSPAELYEYVADRVPVLARDIAPGNRQNPICFPHPGALPKVALVKAKR